MNVYSNIKMGNSDFGKNKKGGSAVDKYINQFLIVSGVMVI